MGLLLIVFQMFVNSYAQPEICKTFKKTISCLSVDSINTLLINKAGIPEKYKNSIAETLLYFPELNDTRIKFKNSRIGTTVNVRPSIGSFFSHSRNNRKYLVRINNSKKDSIILLNEAPNEALIGLFGHEFCHIGDYKTRSNLGIIFLAFSYLNKGKREKYEKSIDSLTINKGLGCSLYKWAVFVQKDSNASGKYKKFKRDVYMEPEEIEKFLK